MALALVLALPACAERQLPEPLSQRAEPARSEALVRAALAHFEGDREGRRLVDSRPLKDGEGLIGLEDADIDLTDSETARLRGRVAEACGLERTDALRDARCAFARGVTVPEAVARSLPDSVRRAHAECIARGIYTTVVLGRPRPVAGEDAVRHPGAWKLRAVRMTTSSYSTWELYLRPAAGGAWEVAEAKRGISVMS